LRLNLRRARSRLSLSCIVTSKRPLLPYRYLECQCEKIVMQVTSWKPALTVECVGVQKVLVPIGEEIVGPDLERRHGNSGLYVFNDYHRQLKAIIGSKIDGLSLEDGVDGHFETLGVQKCDEVTHLVQSVGGVE